MKQIPSPPFWGGVRVKKWSPFFDSGARSPIFGHLKMPKVPIFAEVKKLMVAKVKHLGGDEDEENKHTFSKLSILMMKGNAAILAKRIPCDEIEEGS